MAQLELAVRRARPVTTDEANDAHRRRCVRIGWDEERFFRISRRLADAEGAVVEEAGQALGLGRTTRQVPRWLRRQLRRRDGGCRFSGCGLRRWLHAHHIVFWGQDGPTDPDNLAILCGHHHRLVHEGGWRIEGDPGHELSFVNPFGRVLSTRPAPLRDRCGSGCWRRAVRHALRALSPLPELEA